ncbi:MAG TPA: DUF882 domain-containing protein [Candidatus Eremiobacteraceae bacterium]|nr:DUF882 domain-containing protein [Candidatus Eremiobacteraceae bacterium]
MPILLYMCVDCGSREHTFERQSSIGRRAFLAGGLFAISASGLPFRALAAASSASPSRQYTLFIERMDTGEYAAEPFTVDGKTLYWPGYKKLCAVLRDEHVAPRFGFVQINVRIIEALWAVQRYLVRDGIGEPIIVHSGYRTPQTNARIEGAARLSLHMWGKAVDFHVPGVPLADLAGICEACPISGGVGYYPEGWVHMDTGPKRSWEG